MSEKTLDEVYKKIEECQADVTKMITGLYGGLEAPGTGFIPQTNNKVASIERKVNVLLQEKIEKKKDSQWTVSTLIAAVVAVFAFVKAFFFPGN